MSREGRCEITYIDENRVQEASAHLVDGLTATRLAETFKALSDPTRVRTVSALPHNELRVCDLAATLGMSQSAVSHQLRTRRADRYTTPSTTIISMNCLGAAWITSATIRPFF